MTSAQRQKLLNELLLKGTQANRKLNAKQITAITRDINRSRLDLADLLADYAKKDNEISKARINSLMRELDEIEEQMRKAADKGMRKAIGDTAQAELKSIDAAFDDVYPKSPELSTSFNRINREVVDYVANRFGDDGLVLSDRVWDYAAVKRSNLEAVIKSGIIRSESVNKIISNVRDVYPNDYWKIERMVRTESAIAQRSSHSIYAQKADIPISLRLIRGRADRPEHACTPLSIADDYGLGRGVYPPDKFPSNPHVSCTSTVEYVVDESKLFVGAPAESSGGDTLVNAEPMELSKSKAVKQLVNDPSLARKLGDGGEDLALKTLLSEQGFDKKGSVVTKSQLDQYINQGERELFRGVTSSKFANDFRDGELFAGLGTYGNGTYTAYGSGVLDTGKRGAEGLNVAKEYAGSKGSIMRMTLKADAKVINYDTLLGEIMDFEDELEERLMKATTKKARDAINAEALLAKDFGRFATARGYDAVDVPGEKYLVVLNRTALRIQDENFDLKGDASGYSIK